MDLLLHYRLYGDIDVQEYKLYGDVDKKFNKCLMHEGGEIVVKEYPVPEFKNCTMQQSKRFDFYYVSDEINEIVHDPFYKIETMGDYEIPMRVLDAYNDLYVATLATTEYIYYLHDSDDVLMVGLENRQTIARGEFAMDSYQESFENIYYGNSYEEEIWMDEYEKDAKTQEIESNELEF